MSKVLLIEDDTDIQKIYSEHLKKNGYNVICADNGKQGLQLINSEKPDIVLLDIMLPGGFNGFDVLEHLKKREKLKDIPVIVLTNLETERKVAHTIGVVDYLVKSNTSLGQIVDKISNYLE